MIAIDLIYNLALLVALSVVSGFIGQRWKDGRLGELLQGILFGGAAVIGMLRPLVMAPGLIFDGRSVMISLCGLFFGPWAVGVAGGMATVCRLSQGGMGAVMGVLVILSSALLGWFFHVRWQHRRPEVSSGKLLWFGFLVHSAMVLLMFTLPGPVVFETMKRLGPPVLLLYPLATVLIGKILSDQKANKQYLEELRGSEEKYRELVENANSIILKLDRNGRVMFLNEYGQTFFGYGLDEIMGERVIGTIVPETEKGGRNLAKLIDEMLLDPAKFAINVNENMRRDGSRAWIAWTNRPLCNDNGEVIGMFSVGSDITERKRAEEKLLENEERLNQAMSATRQGWFDLDVRTKKITVSPEYARLLGYEPQEFVPDFEAWVDSIHPEDRAGVVQKFQECLINEGVFSIEYRRRRKTDGWIWILSTGKVVERGGDNEPLRMIGMHVDITERKRAEESLRKSEEKFAKAFMTSPFAITITRAIDGKFIEVNDAFSAISGFTRSEALSDSSIGLRLWADGGDRHWVIARLQEGREVTNREFRFRKKNGEILIGLLSAQQILIDDESCILSSINEITHQKKIEAERERLMSAIEQSTEIIVITDSSGILHYVNPAFEKATGYQRDEMIGQNPRILKSGVQGRAFYEDMWRTISVGKTWRGRLVNRRKDGTLYTEEASISPVFDKAGAIVNYVGVKRDITKEIDLENRLAHAQRIEAIGALAGGIAHDFNNILFPIVGISELLLDDLSPGSLEYENVSEILKAGKRGGDLVKQILSFSRQSDNKKIPVRIQQVLKEVLKLSRATIPAGIEVRSEIESDCRMVLADPTQLHQVAMNLITNAYHAVEENGCEILVRLSEIELGLEVVADDGLEPGRYAILSISDNGHGIDPLLINRIWEPYFTTKAKGKGTGLGLSVVHGIVKQHGGDIRVVSEVGKGTTFDVYFPVLYDAPIMEVNGGLLDLPKGTERILLVDDETPIVRMVQMMLGSLGYQIISRTSSVEALEAFRSNPESFDLVITDMNMPNMNGYHLAAEMVSIRPGIPVILCTGFSERIDEKKAKREGIRGFLMKPVLKSRMAETIRRVLDEDNREGSSAALA